MIVKFSVENYLSFKEKTDINFEAGGIKDYPDSVFSPFYNSNTTLLKSVGIFGHNAGGKSNILKGISFMKDFVLNSSRESNSSQSIRIQPFLLSTTTEHAPSTFEVSFYIDSIKYRYGFSVTNKEVESEWLFFTEKRKESILFARAKQGYTFEKIFKSDFKGKFELYAEVTRANSLFLSVLAQFNNTLCLKISNWFNDLIVASDSAHFNLIDCTAELMTTSDYRYLVTEMMKKADLGIESVEEKFIGSSSTKNVFSDFVLSATKSEEESQFHVRTGHIKYNQDNIAVGKVMFDLLKNESLGTQKFFGILGPILYALKQRKVILIDEIDARMHSLLLESVISLFNSRKYNPNGAQLVFTSHNTHLLKNGLRRDQMAFVEKNEFGVSSLDILHQKAPKVRNDATFDKDYLLGKYGAIPKLGSQLNLFDGESK
ncbi:MAG: ATP-binding protein [Sediminibacterium sp.]